MGEHKGFGMGARFDFSFFNVLRKVSSSCIHNSRRTPTSIVAIDGPKDCEPKQDKPDQEHSRSTRGRAAHPFYEALSSAQLR